MNDIEYDGKTYATKHIARLPKDARCTEGVGWYSCSLADGCGGWVFKKCEDIPSYLFRDVALGRVFVLSEAKGGAN